MNRTIQSSSVPFAKDRKFAQSHDRQQKREQCYSSSGKADDMLNHSNHEYQPDTFNKQVQ